MHLESVLTTRVWKQTHGTTQTHTFGLPYEQQMHTERLLHAWTIIFDAMPGDKLRLHTQISMSEKKEIVSCSACILCSTTKKEVAKILAVSPKVVFFNYGEHKRPMR